MTFRAIDTLSTVEVITWYATVALIFSFRRDFDRIRALPEVRK